ncbi:threonine aldolase family protein [Mucilaginibacter sp.]|jgi:threonine aldolase|uniref:threonine aldolase family protein n=1 Tax=Mucilaginibacter sp. TaxID=1882438 RepID=UPI002C96DB6F|nr:aminotransferase class I/II-fold pyridoxal phosphate-dependent enzyme [Mucilaginibacter sp.]HTI57433.1 aminotransferase class I/II-fold pyridoxal phosphate-dependent enzyme [Mucilaginibacter sp.]
MEPFKKINFSSENYAGVHPKMMEALIAANTGNAASYGNDEITKGTVALFKQIFGENIEAYFTFNGTGANNFGLSCMLDRFNSIFCADLAHLYVDESTAPESFLGCRIYPVKSHNGKIVADELKVAVKRIGDVHHPQPKVVSLTQPTEYGTVYTVDELKAIKAVCIANNMLLHVDGARFYNAAAYLGVSLKQISAEVGVDVLTLGGTKIGMMMGEAVIFFSPANAASLKFNLKRSMQLASKNRFIAIQFQALLKDNLWQDMAEHTNKLAKLFEQEIAGIQPVKMAYPVETNAAFLNISPELHEKMQDFASFYYWNDERREARLIFSFDNTEEDVKRFVAKLRELAG